MSPPDLPAIAGGTPCRESPLPYGRHQLEESDVAAVVACLRSGTLTGGADVERFERGLAQRCGVEHAVALSNGTAALDLAVAALGIGPGDEVVTTPLTFVATASAILRNGATPVFADIGADRSLDPGSVRSVVTARTKAVIVVDYAGLPADVDAIRGALPRRIPIVADASHSLGGALAGRPVGSLADVTTLSFHPVKLITTGEGGACVTADAPLAEAIRLRRNHGMTSTAEERAGRSWRYDVAALGSNHRMSAVQAALGSSQLLRIDALLDARRALALRYDDLLGPIPGIVLPPRPLGRESGWHLYAIEVMEDRYGCSRDALIDALRAEGIQATLHYPAVHLLAAYRARGFRPGIAPKAEALCKRLLSLPLFPAMSRADQDDVVRSLLRIHRWAQLSARPFEVGQAIGSGRVR
ncbi:MAG: DegT/DnrJ/EryC1/StrS family aminotransferase [Candidatus Dormiibacterota bacterium]